jgi:hypothetical protein
MRVGGYHWNQCYHGSTMTSRTKKEHMMGKRCTVRRGKKREKDEKGGPMSNQQLGPTADGIE